MLKTLPKLLGIEAKNYNENAGFNHSGSLLVDVEDSSQNVNNWGLSAPKL